MKIMHTGDWHIGHSLYKSDRSEEQAAFLKQIAAIVEEEKPDVMVVCGDIFHTVAPSIQAQQLYIDAMIEIHRRHPSMAIVVTSGNHDSASRLEVTAPLWGAFGIDVVGTMDADLEKHIIEVSDADGVAKGYVIAVPYAYAGNIPQVAEGEDRLSEFCKALQERVAQRNVDNLPVVMTGHYAVTGCDIKGHDDVVGGIDYYELSRLGDGYDYLALGHIHRPQTLIGSHGKARYSGSPIPVHFDEQYPHSVTIVTIESRNAQPEIREVEIENPKPLLTIPAEPRPFEEALEELVHLNVAESAYIRLNVLLCDGYLPVDSMQRVEAAIADKPLQFCLIQSSREAAQQSAQELKLSAGELREASPIDIARRYYLEKQGVEMDDELLGLMSQVVNKLLSKDEEE